MPAVAIASDHAGFAMKAELADTLRGEGHEVIDLGPETADRVDYPDFADRLAAALADGRAGRGVLICGSGIGIAMAANRHAHIRAASCADATMARLARAHNDANVLALGARLVGPEVARDCLIAFLSTPFEGGRHEGRLAKFGRRP